MRRYIPLHFFSRVLIAVILSASINCLHENVHATQSLFATVGSRATASGISDFEQCLFPPLEQATNYDCCDACFNCACHAPLTIQPFRLHYDPMVLKWSSSEPFMHLPEVFLPMFIPPESQA